MGNFHCIPEACGAVVYREYLPPVVRWRYPNEEWNEIEGDDYEVEELPGQCCGTWDITVSYAVPGCNGIRAYSGTTTRRIPYGTFKRLEYTLNNRFTNTVIQIVYWDCYQKIEKTTAVWSSTGKSSAIANCGDPEAIHDMSGSIYQIDNIVRVDSSDQGCTKCKFIIYKKGQIVHSEEREECPEVEKLPCRLSDEVKEIKIEKEAYLQRIEVRNQSIDVVYIPFTEVPLLNINQLPQECLNIYNTYTGAAPILIEDSNLPGILNFYIFIAQICSAPECPPPKYQVICDCECESCPDGTCPIECGAHICCYDSTGIAIKSIPIDQYCDKSK